VKQVQLENLQIYQIFF